MHIYKTHGTCSHTIETEIHDGVVTHCTILGGCPGNTAGLQRLAIGQRADHLVQTLQGISCKNGTSCPDQLAKALQEQLRAP